MRRHGPGQKSEQVLRRPVTPAVARKAAQRGSGSGQLAVLRQKLGNAGLARVLRSAHEAAVQRMCSACESEQLVAREPMGMEEEEEEKVATSRLQRKATVSDPGDADEVEADHVADQVMRMEDPDAVGAAAPSIQRRVAREASGDSSSGLDADGAVRAAQQGSGSPLSDSARSFFEPRFNADLSHVRVHTDGAAATAARSVDARAYTVGSDIVFNSGEYSPDTAGGKRLLAHELTHVIQQSGGQG